MHTALYKCGLLLFLFIGGQTVCAQKYVQGFVVDETGERLIGVNVVGVKSGTGTITELDGSYRIKLPESEIGLVFSYIGMERRVVDIDHRDTINVTLNESTAEMKEVVVTAYSGPKEHRELVGSYSQATNEELETLRPIESLDQMLEGKVAGVQVESTGGEPGLPVKV